MDTLSSSPFVKYVLHLLNRMDEARQPLSRKVPISSSRINPYRMIIIIRLVVLGFFFHYRVMHPVNDAFALWLISVICEIWFAMSWILDQFPKWLPIERETYLDRLSLRLVKCHNWLLAIFPFWTLMLTHFLLVWSGLKRRGSLLNLLQLTSLSVQSTP
jgi:hypothetical protein